MEEDSVVRSVLHPRIFQTGVISPLIMMRPGRSALVSGRKGMAISVGAGSKLPTDEAAHNFGCRVAAKANKAIQDRADKESRLLQRGEDTVHYIASLDIDVAAVEALDSPLFDLGVVPRASAGLEEHCHIEFRPKADDWADDDNAPHVTDVVERLFALLRNPRSKICQVDEDLSETLVPICDSVMAYFQER